MVYSEMGQNCSTKVYYISLMYHVEYSACIFITSEALRNGPSNVGIEEVLNEYI